MALLRRAASSEDVVDTAVIGGISLGEILAGKVSESQIPERVLDAFHAQFPNHGSSFVEAVHHLAQDPERLAGLVNGVKGKLFELDYVDWLKHGHLPDGWTAELAHHANNPNWDVVIHDSHGHAAELIQNKAAETLVSAREAIAAHPDIHVALTHEMFEHAAGQPDLAGHVIDGHIALHDLNGQVADAVSHAEGATLPFDFPVIGPAIAVGLAIGQNYRRYRTGSVSKEEAWRNIGERGILSTVASTLGWATTLLAGEPLVGLPVSVVTRLFGGQFYHNRKRRALLSQYVETVEESRKLLEIQAGRRLLQASHA